MTDSSDGRLTRAEFVAMVDHTLLSPTATAADIDALCDEAVALGALTVCVNGAWVARAARRLDGDAVGVCSVVGFPLGAMAVDSVVGEAVGAVADGAAEIDMVLPIGPLLAGDADAVAAAIGGVRSAIGAALLKVIVESAVLDDGALRAACSIAVDQGADFVKTSTGFHAAGGATVEAVTTMRAVVGARAGVKASGGIRDRATVEAMVAAGATRLGLSATASIAAEFD